MPRQPETRIAIPPRLVATCRSHDERGRWLAALPDMVAALESRWSLQLHAPFDNATCAWVAPATRADGTHAVLKVQMPHMEGADEIAGLRFWDGEPTAALLDAEPDQHAMLLERCMPGTPL